MLLCVLVECDVCACWRAGERHVHTGDFRACSDIWSHCSIGQHKVHTVYLDTVCGFLYGGCPALLMLGFLAVTIVSIIPPPPPPNPNPQRIFPCSVVGSVMSDVFGPPLHISFAEGCVELCCQPCHQAHKEPRKHADCGWLLHHWQGEGVSCNCPRFGMQSLCKQKQATGMLKGARAKGVSDAKKGGGG